MNRADILDTAKSHITKDRASTHGSPESSFASIGALWSADLGITITATDVARLMVLFKCARAKANSAHHDNWVDAAGYAACGGEIATGATPVQEAKPIGFCPNCGEFITHGHTCGGEIATKGEAGK